MNRELDAQISTFMGYREGEDGYWEIGTKGQADYGNYWPGPIPYTANLDYCHTAELRLIELGKGEEYARGLSNALAMQDGSFTLSLLTAPAEARCRAMLSVLEGV